MSISAYAILPRDWRDLIKPGKPVGIGLDLGTTENKKSNPSALCIMQQDEPDYVAAVVSRWKTRDPDVMRQVLRQAIDLPHGLMARRLCVDATSERFWAADLRQEFRLDVDVDLVVSSESIEHLGERMLYKVYLGNLLVNMIDDGHLLLPASDWLTKDVRQVKRERGTFFAEVASDGAHGDAFDAIKLALHALTSDAGPIEVGAVDTGGSVAGRPPDPREYDAVAEAEDSMGGGQARRFG